MSCSKPMYEPSKCDGQPCPGDCDLGGCPLAYTFDDEDEPQTETETVREIIHKMIDNTELAEDAYPNLRKRLHDAVDEYEPQTDCPWK